ncbi:MAG: 50S ribosomal protein L30 [Prevotellaceae bacterium]|jgi:large subunit ribosomal protein L30|nr:50S ribosomal protein L30 [Prevotellaceae bacterium]
MAKIKIQKVRSTIKSPKNQKLVMESLGLRKMNSIVEHDDTPSILGMVYKVKHLIKIID